MLLGDLVICGTSTTGAGTLTLAAAPSPLNGIDFDVWLRAQGFANSVAVRVSYVIKEYVNPIASNLGALVQLEKGVGVLTLGGSAGITNCTLARTTVQVTGTGINSSPAFNLNAPSAISIGTAANVTVEIDPSSAESDHCSPYYDNTGDVCVLPASTQGVSTPASAAIGALAGGTMHWIFFWWRTPGYFTKCLVKTGTSAAADASNSLNAAIYDLNTIGRPERKLVDFGAFAGSNVLNTTATLLTATASTGVLLLPGVYALGLLATRGTPSGTPNLRGLALLAPGLGSNSSSPIIAATSTETLSGGLMPDPPALTSYTRVSGSGGNTEWFGLA